MDFRWVFGRSLYIVNIGDKTIRYAYDQEGTRTSKTIGDSFTKYHIIDDVMYGEKTTGTNGTTEIFYFYDDNDRMYGFSYNGTMYYYQFNLQGDVIGIYDANGQLVVEYKYDAWGKVLSITGSLANTIGQSNPIRYRGYYYDNETGFYYLNTRYYDPEVGRFINADSQVADVGAELLGNNMFAYCLNNPINMSDPTGNWPKWATKVVAAVAVVAVVAAVAAVTVATAGAGTVIASVAVGAAKGAATGLLVGAIAGGASGAISHRITTASWKGVGKSILNGIGSGALSGAISGAISGGVGSGVCFVAGTSVLTATGHVAIEDIVIGDKVWAENPTTGEKELKDVVQTFINETNELVHVFANSEEIITTPEHPFYSPIKGWIAAINLRAGDILLLQNGKYLIVEAIQHEILERPVTVYNFEVADFHTYYVGNSSILVHNTCGTGNTSKQIIKNDIIDLPRTGSALKQDAYHAFSDIVDNYAGYATKSSISNGTLYQLQGSLNGVAGRFEWIVQNHSVTHRLFVKGGTINGIPILP